MRVKGAPANTPTMTVTAVTENREGGFTIMVTWYVDGEWKKIASPVRRLGGSKNAANSCSDLDGQPLGPVTSSN